MTNWEKLKSMLEEASEQCNIQANSGRMSDYIKLNQEKVLIDNILNLMERIERGEK